MKRKIILLYPYYNGTSGAYNRYILLKKLIKKIKVPVELITISDRKYSSDLSKIINKIITFLKVEFLIFYYTLLKKYFFITDFNPSLIALFSKKVFIQIHDVSWENKNFARHNLFQYKIFLFFIKNYKNIITVSKTSLEAIKKISGREKKITYLYNSVTCDYIKKSNNIAKNINLLKNNHISEFIDLNLPNLIYVATLSPRKCHFDLLEAISKTENLLNINLVGYPNDKKIKELIKSKSNSTGKEIKSNINYFPKLSQKDLCTILLYSSAYVSTSMSEGFGIPVLEAQLYGIPIIIRDIDVNRELFPKAKFFNSTIGLINLLNKIKPLSKYEIRKRKKILLDINEENLMGLFNYSNLSNQIRKLIE